MVMMLCISPELKVSNGISLLLVFWQGNNFFGQTIFISDYERRQEVIRNTHLYDSVFLARFSHNKLKIITDKFIYNFFAITDLNNYFFGFHPRQIVGNQNISKYPYPFLVFFLRVSTEVVARKGVDQVGLVGPVFGQQLVVDFFCPSEDLLT